MWNLTGSPTYSDTLYRVTGAQNELLSSWDDPRIRSGLRVWLVTKPGIAGAGVSTINYVNIPTGRVDLISHRDSFTRNVRSPRFDGLGTRGRLSPDRRSRKAWEVRVHLVEDE
jgi:hypothetical protein